MVEEIAIIAGSSVAGVISAAVLDRLGRIREGNSSKRKAQAKPATAARAELASLLFEKSLTSEAITRVYEAAQGGRVDRVERDRLLLKYKQQLDSLNQRIASMQPVADYADLSELRNNLVSLLENKISALDSKLLEMSKAGVLPEVVDLQVKRIVDDISRGQPQHTAGDGRQDHGNQYQHHQQQRQQPFAPEEKSIEQLQKEIMQALHRLEQVEIDKD